MNRADWRWPGDKPIAVVFNVCLEAWSDGKAPGISPMGNPLPAGALDTMAISWAAYGHKRGIYRILDALKHHAAKASVMTNAIIAKRARGWLSPRGTSGPDLPPLLAEAEYKWYGDVFDDDLPYVQEFGENRIVAIPLSTDVNDMPFMKYGNAPRSILDSFEENLVIAREDKAAPTLIDVTVHAHIFGRPRGAHYFEKIVARAVSAPDVWVATRLEIADFALARNET